jgi:hypothetical protein
VTRDDVRAGRAFGSEVVKIAPVTLPALQFLEKGPPVDDEPERREVADKFAEFRTIRAGVECWQAISTVNTFAASTKIAKSLQVGRQAALRATGANRPAGQIYCKAFSAWIDQHGFNGIEKSVRSAALDLLEHLAEIESFPATLREKRRRQLRHPLSNVAAWRKATQQAKGTDLHKAAVLAWQRFCALTMELPVDEARPLWQSVAAEATTHVG